jgi:hypothetical protein
MDADLRKVRELESSSKEAASRAAEKICELQGTLKSLEEMVCNTKTPGLHLTDVTEIPSFFVIVLGTLRRIFVWSTTRPERWSDLLIGNRSRIRCLEQESHAKIYGAYYSEYMGNSQGRE